MSFIEDSPTYRSAAAPEGHRFTAGLLVNKMVKKILVLRNEVGCGWCVIVGAKYRGDIGVGLEVPHQALNAIGLNDDI